MRSSGFLVGAMLTSVAPAVAAAEPTKAECATAYEQAQEQRAASHLIQARQALIVCAQRTCPAFVQKDCAEWLTEVKRQVPSVIVTAKGPDGHDTVAVKLTIDGELRTTELDGKAIELDPGAHTFRFEYEGFPSKEQTVVVRQAERDRPLEVRFDAPRETQVVTPPPPAEPRKPGPLRPYAYVAGGIGVAGLVGFGVLGYLGKQRESELKDECAGRCSDKDVDAVKTKYLIADISLGVGVAGLATGALFYFLSAPSKRESAAPRSTSFDVVPVHGGGRAVFSTQF